MSGSSKKINYDLRPAKYVERRMFINSLKGILYRNDLKSYQYVGMGSSFFTDFKLIHKELNIDSLHSIESTDFERVKFNTPYECIKLYEGTSTDKLTDIDWESKSIVWLDYDDVFKYSMLTDIDIVFRRLKAGSIYFFSCNKQLKEYLTEVENEKTYTLEKFFNEFNEYANPSTSVSDLLGEKDFITIKKMIELKIKESLDTINLELEESEKLAYYPLYFFLYQDGARMISIGGFIEKISEGFKKEKYNLDAFDFIVQDDTPYKIDIPILTPKEINKLNEKIPGLVNDILTDENLKFLKPDVIKQYQKFYKYLPHFVDVNH